MKHIKLYEQFEDEEESWWEEESPFDNSELERGDMVYIMNGKGVDEFGIILDVSTELFGIGTKRSYYACRKEDVRRLTKEEKDDSKNKLTKKDLERW